MPFGRLSTSFLRSKTLPFLAALQLEWLGPRALCLAATGLLQLLRAPGGLDGGGGGAPWRPAFQLLERCARYPGPAAAAGFTALRYLVLESDLGCAAVHADCFGECVDAVLAFAEPPQPPPRADGAADAGGGGAAGSDGAAAAGGLPGAGSAGSTEAEQQQGLHISLNALNLLHMIPGEARETRVMISHCLSFLFRRLTQQAFLHCA